MNSPLVSVPDHPSIFVIKGAVGINNSITKNWTVLPGLQKALNFTQPRVLTVSLLIGVNGNNLTQHGGTAFAISAGDEMIGRHCYSLHDSSALTSVFIEDTFQVQPGPCTIQAHWKPSVGVSSIGDNAAPTMKIHIHEIGTTLYR